MKNLLITISLFLYCLNCETNAFDSMQIKDLNLTKCDQNTNYSVTVENIKINLGQKPKINISGTLITLIDLIHPIEAKLWLERYVLGIWIHVPCVDNWGSCTFNDLCKFGYPNNETCPAIFIEDKVPCRCPIFKGNYTILPTRLDLTHHSSLYTGYYKGTVNLKHADKILSCYNIQFELYNEESDIKIHYIR